MIFLFLVGKIKNGALSPKKFGGSIMFKVTDEYGKEVMIDTAQ